MKRVSLLIVLFAGISITTYAQNKSNFNPEIYDFGQGKIINSALSENNDFIFQEFKVEVNEAGKYYLAAWVNGSLNEKGEKLEYVVQVNDKNVKYKIKSKSDNSHAIVLKEKQIDLESGINTIVFKTEKPGCPNVEFIKVSLDKEKKAISNKKYINYINELSKHKLPDNYAEIKKTAKEAEQSNSKSYKLPNPEGNYNHEMELDFGYAYYRSVYLYAGNIYTFETRNATSDPVLQLFKNSSTASYTWTNDDGGLGYNSKITAYITSSGIYYLFIRKYINPSSVVGTCNLYRNGSLFSTNCAISGSGIRCDKSVTETLNWFTADLFGDSRIWIEDQTGFPGKIVAYNDDWNVSSNFPWRWSSRVRSNLNTSIRAVIVSCYSSYYPSGNCDLYMNCKNSSITSSFPNLKTYDAIQSASSSNNYNCASWGGGLIDLGRYFWASNSPSSNNISGDWYVENNFWKSWDNYFGNNPPRFAGAPNYTRLGATSTDGRIAMWYNSTSGQYTHVSVTKPANNQPHGYDWESKPGGLMRTFHP